MQQGVVINNCDTGTEYTASDRVYIINVSDFAVREFYNDLL